MVLALFFTEVRYFKQSFDSYMGLSHVLVFLCVFAAVLFLEFWKRRQFQLQYDWDMLGYEDAEVDKPHM